MVSLAVVAKETTMKYELVGSWLIADGQTILFPGSRRDLKAAAELVRRANAYDGLLEACKMLIGSHRSHGPCENMSCGGCQYAYGFGVSAIASAEGGAK